MVDPVWIWCPDCGMRLDRGDHLLDLTAMEAELDDHRRAFLLGYERYPTEWAQSA